MSPSQFGLFLSGNRNSIVAAVELIQAVHRMHSVTTPFSRRLIFDFLTVHPCLTVARESTNTFALALSA